MGSNVVPLVLWAATLVAGFGLSAAAQQRLQFVENTPILERFERHDNHVWWRTDDRAGGKPTNDTGFRKENIHIAGGRMALRLTDADHRGRGNTGASYKSRGLYHYGRYDAVMKPARGAGVISAFYTYTGPVYGDPHDEIDFEFLGRNTKEVQLNYFVNGAPQLGLGVPLGFDAADDFHLYTIIWAPGRIVWKVDNREIYRIEGPLAATPQHPGKIIADIWAAKDLNKWAGRLDDQALPATAIVRCISFQPEGGADPTCADAAP